MWSEPRFLAEDQVAGLRELMVRIVAPLLPGRDYEVWEAADDLRPFFQVAGHLARGEAIRVAHRHAAEWPRQPVVVLDRNGGLVCTERDGSIRKERQ